MYFKNNTKDEPHRAKYFLFMFATVKYCSQSFELVHCNKCMSIILLNQKAQISKLLVHFNLFPGHRQHFF